MRLKKNYTLRVVYYGAIMAHNSVFFKP